MLKLFYTPGACSLASHIALEEAGASFELARVNLKAGEQRNPEYLKLNPKGRVPAFATDRGVLTENPAILAYVAQSFPKAKLAPLDDPYAFAEVQSFNAFLATSVHVSFAHAFRPERYGEDSALEGICAKVPASLNDYFGLIEQRFSDGRDWVAGGAYTIADAYLYVFTGWLQRGDFVDASRIANVMKHYARVEARPAVQRALAAEAA